MFERRRPVRPQQRLRRRPAALAWLIGALALANCERQLPAGREQDVLRAVVADVLLPLGPAGKVLVVGRPSDCQTRGQTNAPVPAVLFNAFLTANEDDSAPVDLQAISTRLQVDSSGTSPRALSARTAKTVVAVSKVGIAEDQALACLEVFGGEETGFFLLLSRNGGDWSLDSELPVWRDEATRPAEELPDGTMYDEGS